MAPVTSRARMPERWPSVCPASSTVFMLCYVCARVFACKNCHPKYCILPFDAKKGSEETTCQPAEIMLHCIHDAASHLSNAQIGASKRSVSLLRISPDRSDTRVLTTIHACLHHRFVLDKRLHCLTYCSQQSHTSFKKAKTCFEGRGMRRGKQQG